MLRSSQQQPGELEIKLACAKADFQSHMKRLSPLVASLVLMLASAIARADCGIVYGEFWAFAFSTPTKWSSLCRAEKLMGAPLALWHENSTFANSEAVMYVTASAKDKRSLAEFVTFSQDQFRQQAPGVKFVPLENKEGTGKLRAVQYSATGDPGGNYERICYIEGPASYFVVVLSARTSQALAKATQAFGELLGTFVPMSAKVEK